MTRILIVEDEQRLRRDLVDFLGLCGFTAEGTATAEGLRQTLANDEPPDVIILDVGLPDGNGFDLASEIREAGRCGIIMLTALGDGDDRIRGFESGADIYLVKHSTLREIEAAIRSLLRRTGDQGDLADGGAGKWALDSRNWTLTAPNQRSLKLTATEFALVNTLCKHDGGICRREELAETLARPRTHFDNRHLDAVVSRLRRKIGEQTNLHVPIKVVYGVGYTFTAPTVVQ
ncbi:MULTISPECIES: response regulator transcription factor [unclassified Ensifer]|uniref:response regulator transcription factor n=1 Tax=unclassified Ensifer TaxID=2633371 RepID=UPI00070B2135|nr:MULTISPECIES: response regulator transcription factor [unclassified Ensifer]KQU83081.1 two-component system response regulator [Ensifer sp. Root31]KQW59809.1 two-component system response regulator [Ensifer sp. Root1252]KQW78593.1 two-component system response regulator [Ensifer sp. Root127]KQY67099.1 two-component system response regulator [Ensifer sp. Root142]KRC74011.1 two-component system response regulator [Ensifer sp. Root231]